MMQAGMIICLMVFVFPLTHGGEFYGGGLTWRPVEDDTAIEITHRVSYIPDASGEIRIKCLKSRVLQRRNIVYPKPIRCVNNCGGNVAPNTRIICTDEAFGDWHTATIRIDYNPGSRKRFTIATTNADWFDVPNLGTPKSARYHTLVDNRIRTDTKRANNPPVTAVLPEVRIPGGCSQTLRIPVTDDDADVIRCRFATTPRECGAACNSRHSGITLSEDCVLSITMAVPNGKYAIAYVVEDYLTTDFTGNPLSEVSYQFVLEMYSTNPLQCDHKADYVDPQGRVNSPRCYGRPLGNAFDIVVRARPVDPSLTMVALHTLTPSWSTQSDITSVSDYYEVTINVRGITEEGSHMLCYQADFGLGKRTEMRCEAIFIAGKEPWMIGTAQLPDIPAGTSFPVHDITFDEQVVLNPDDRWVTLHDIPKDANVVYPRYKSSEVLTIPNGNNQPYTVRVTLPSTAVYKDNGAQMIDIEEGFVVSKPKTNCGLEVRRAMITVPRRTDPTTTTTVTSTETTTATSTETTTGTSTETTTETTTGTTTGTTAETTTGTTTAPPVIKPKKSKCKCSCNCEPEMNVKKSKKPKRKKYYQDTEYCGK